MKILLILCYTKFPFPKHVCFPVIFNVEISGGVKEVHKHFFLNKLCSNQSKMFSKTFQQKIYVFTVDYSDIVLT